MVVVLLCPVCKRKGKIVNMIYDPVTHEYVCPECGHIIEDTEVAYVPLTEDGNPGYGRSFYSIPDKNLGGKLTPRELREIIVSVRSKKRTLNRHEIDFLLSPEENKVFQENMNTIKMVISNLRKKGYKLTNLDVEDVIRLIGKVFKRSSNETNRRFYSSIYVFLAVLYHYLIYKRLDKQRKEILDDIVEASIDYLDSNDPKNVARQIERKYDLIKAELPKYNITYADKIMAVASRFGLDPNDVLSVAQRVLNKKILNNHSADSVAFGVVYYYMKDILKTDIPKEIEEKFPGGVKAIYKEIKKLEEKNKVTRQP